MAGDKQNLQDSFLNNDHSLNKYESEYLNDQIQRLGNYNKKVHQFYDIFQRNNSNKII